MAKKEDEQIWTLEPHKCPICGKEFYPAVEWVYKDIDGIYCTWKCLRQNQKNLEDFIKKYKYKKCEQLTLDGQLVATYPCAYDAVVAIDGSLPGIRDACRKNLVYKGYLWRYKDEEKEEK